MYYLLICSKSYFERFFQVSISAKVIRMKIKSKLLKGFLRKIMPARKVLKALEGGKIDEAFDTCI